MNGKKSKVYSGQITYYDADFTSGGVVISIEGVSTGLTSIGNSKSKSYSKGRISDYVKKIAEEEGWKIGFIEKTKKVSDGEKAASVKSKLFSPSDIQSIMKKAMVDRLKSQYEISWFPEDGASFPVRVFLMKDEVTAGLDIRSIAENVMEKLFAMLEMKFDFRLSGDREREERA